MPDKKKLTDNPNYFTQKMRDWRAKYKKEHNVGSQKTAFYKLTIKGKTYIFGKRKDIHIEKIHKKDINTSIDILCF